MKIVAITGGAQGIGRAIAYHFAKAGYAVSLADPDQDAGGEALAKLQERGAKAVFVPTDVARGDEVERWMEQTVEGLGCPTCWSTMPASAATSRCLNYRLPSSIAS